MEKREAISLDDTEQRRLRILNHLLEGAITAEQAATILGRSVRQIRRLLAAYRAAGAEALVHGNRGRRPTNRTTDEHRQQIVTLATTRYGGLNREHTTELLAEEQALSVAPRTLRRWLSDEGVPTVRRRRAPQHRRRRERMARAGLLLQVDGSRHEWLAGRGPVLTLVGGIDDATGLVTGAIFRDQEDAAGYFTLLVQTVRRHGRPMAIYSDRHGIFWRDPTRHPTLAEELTGKRSLTQLGRALDDADIGWIPARSPQAKGRVERLWGTLQERLVGELRLAGADSLESANTVLGRHLARHNRRFAVPPADEQPAWRDWPMALPPEAVFCFCYPRRVAPDATISWSGETLALPRRRDGRAWGRQPVTIQERLDGSLWALDGIDQYPLKEAPPVAAVLRARHLRREQVPPMVDHATGETAGARPPSAAWKPAPDHPWRRSIKERG